MMRTRSAVLLAGGVGYSLIAASTTPFTLPADILTGLAIVAMAVLVCVSWPLRTRKVRAAAAAAAAAASATSSASSASTASTGSSASTGRPYLPWIVLLIVFVVWELFNYLVHGTRANHPTFSSITDAIDRTYLLKTLMFLGWLAGGLAIIRLGSRAGARRAGHAGHAGRAGRAKPVQP
jgi:hypothetical protein